MANDLEVLENQLTPLAPRFAQVLPPGLPVERLIRTVLVSVERTPKLLQCNRQTLFNAAMSAAVLGLEVDGATGQAFLIPYGNSAQLVIGYKGMSTMAARSGYTLSGGVVREGDEFDYEEGTNGFVKHKRALGSEKDRRIIAAWATATAQGRTPIVVVLSIDELMAVKDRSPGARFRESPWNDPGIGFPAMCTKTAMRRLARFMPLNVMQLGARMDEAFDEQGKHAWISPEKGVVIEADSSPIPERENSVTPTAQQLISSADSYLPAEDAPPLDRPASEPEAGHYSPPMPSAQDYAELWDANLTQAMDAKILNDSWNVEKKLRASILWPEDESDPTHWTQIRNRVVARIEQLKKPGKKK